MTRPRLMATPAIRSAAAQSRCRMWVGPSNRERRIAAYRATRALLATRFRLAFSAARPLAIGIHLQVRAAVDEDELSTQELARFLTIWTGRAAYKAAIARGDRRINLDGSDAGPAVAEAAE